MPHHLTTPWSLRDLPLAARLVLSLFLVGTGFGYLAALSQLHFAHSKSGTLLPTSQDVREIYGSGAAVVSALERLLEAPESAPFNGQGSMQAAFFSRSSDWKKVQSLPQEEQQRIRQEREGERQALLAWIRAGAPREPYEEDKWPLPEALKNRPITPDYAFEDGGIRFVKLTTLVTDRCLRCHMEGGVDTKAARYPLDSFAHLEKYLKPASTGFTIERLAQHTHTHLLSLTVLFTLTGLCFALTTYPAWLRLIVAPLVLLAQLAEFACWWLARWQPAFADGIIPCGTVVGVGLGLQVVGTLFHLFGWKGKVVLAVLMLATLAAGGWLWVTIVAPHLAARNAGH